MKLEAASRLKMTANSDEHPAGDELTQASLIDWFYVIVQRNAAGAEVKQPPQPRRRKSNLGSLVLPSVKPKDLAKMLVQQGYKGSGHGTMMRTVGGKRCVVVMDPTEDGKGSEIYVNVA